MKVHEVGACAAELTGVRILEATFPQELAAHRSQLRGKGRGARLMRVLAALPVPAFGLLLGREWFAEPTRPAIEGVTGGR